MRILPAGLAATLVLSLPVLLPTGATAASFDCTKATLPAERTICGNANLSRLDEQTAGMYFTIIGSGAPAATVSEVKQSQVTFLARRNACGADVDCLVSAYTDRMMFLKTVKDNLGL